MDSNDFIESDKQVFNALLNWPGLTDREISEKVGIKESTFRAARLRLEEKELIKDSIIPNFMGIGCELIFIVFSKIKPGITTESRNIFLHSIEMQCKGAFFTVTSENQILVMGSSKNLTEAKKYNRAFYEAELRGIIELDSIREYYISLELINDQRFFEFAPMIADYFHLDREELPESRFHNGEIKELSDNEKTVIYSLCKWPELAGAQISEKVGMPKPTFSVIQRRLLGEGMIHPAKLPNINNLNCEMLVFVYSHINPHKVNSIHKSLFGNNSFFSSTYNYESYDLLIYRNYSAFQERFYQKIRELEEGGIIVKSPEVQAFSLPNSNIIRFMEFDHLLRDFYHLIEIEDELGEIIIKNYMGKDKEKAKTAVSGVLTEVASMVGEETTKVIYKSKVEKLKLNNRIIKETDIMDFIDVIQREVVVPLLGGKSKKIQRFRQLLG